MRYLWLHSTIAHALYLWMHNISCQNMSSCCHRGTFTDSLLLPAAVGAQDVVSLGEEATSHQRHGAQHADEALAVPLALLEGDVLRPSQTCAHQTDIGVFTFRANRCIFTLFIRDLQVPC